jgi:Rrf2 family protein
VTRAGSRLAIAAQALVLLADAERGMATSAELGDALDVHPVEIRRLLALLRAEGVVESRRGAKGGWAIARDPARITLGAVHAALAGDADVVSPLSLDEALTAADRAYREALERVTLADLLG